MLNPNFRRCSPSFHHFLWPWGERPCHGPLRSFSSPVPRSPSAPLGPRCQSPGRWGSAQPGGGDGIWEFGNLILSDILRLLTCWCFKSYWLCVWSSWLDLTCLTMYHLIVRRYHHVECIQLKCDQGWQKWNHSLCRSFSGKHFQHLANDVDKLTGL